VTDLPATSVPKETARSSRSRTAYIVLALLGGSSGWHNFYAGRWMQGGLQLLLTLPSLWVAAQWMKEIAPLAATLSNADAPDLASNVTALIQIGLPSSPLLLGALASGIWATLDIFLVKTDGAGLPLR
jgi:TM2 domain-containing membrane protein YozV